MKYLISILFVITTFAQPLLAQQQSSLVGDWKGTINIPSKKTSIKTHFRLENDSLTGSINIQDATLELQNIEINKPDSVFFEFIAGPGLAEFKGTFESDSVINGSFHQRGMQFPFELERYEAKVNTVQQTDKSALPYQHKDMIIKNDSIKIGGTLTWPKNNATDKLVIMMSGSGAQDRDETLQPLSNFKPFALLADSLTTNGIATFRYDDRGVGKSTGDFGNTTLGMLASDVKAIISKFTDDRGQDFDEIILLGHSQGGVVGGKVAARNNHVDKLILMASTGAPLKEVSKFQVRRQYKQAGIPDSLIQAEFNARERLRRALNEDKNLEQAKKNYREQLRKRINILTTPDQVKDKEAIINKELAGLISIYTNPQFNSLLSYNPVNDFKKLNIPVLVLFGGKDTQVKVEMNKPPIKKGLEKAGVPYRIEVFKQANHPFQKAKTGSVQEYSTLKNEFVDGFTALISQWINKHSYSK